MDLEADIKALLLARVDPTNVGSAFSARFGTWGAADQYDDSFHFVPRLEGTIGCMDHIYSTAELQFGEPGSGVHVTVRSWKGNHGDFELDASVVGNLAYEGPADFAGVVWTRGW